MKEGTLKMGELDFVEIVLDGPLPVDRDDIEDALNEAFADSGEVTGAGSGRRGMNLDLEVDGSEPRSVVLERVFGVIADLGVGDAARVRPGDGEVWIRPSQWPAHPFRQSL